MREENGRVLVDVRKYDGTLSARWTADRLGSDAHGVWLGTARGVTVRAEAGGWTSRFAYVLLVPPDAWWTATFCVAPGPEMYCDVCTVPEWNAAGTEVRMVDLDLDVVRLRGAAPHVEDEAEFEDHRVRYGYPEHVVNRARQACTWLMEACRGDGPGTEPFASEYRDWVALVE